MFCCWLDFIIMMLMVRAEVYTLIISQIFYGGVVETLVHLENTLLAL